MNTICTNKCNYINKNNCNVVVICNKLFYYSCTFVFNNCLVYSYVLSCVFIVSFAVLTVSICIINYYDLYSREKGKRRGREGEKIEIYYKILTIATNYNSFKL